MFSGVEFRVSGLIELKADCMTECRNETHVVTTCRPMTFVCFQSRAC